MRDITLYFTKSSLKLPVFSWIIRVIWNTEYSHTAMSFYSTKYDKELIYHASGTGLNFMSKSIFLSKNIIVYKKDIEVTQEVYDAIMSKSIDLAGSEYGIVQAIGLGISHLLSKVGIIINGIFSDGRNKWICSEWSADSLSMIFPHYKPDLDTVTPKDVYDFVKNLP